MRLSEFILLNMEQILTQWESFAATVLPDTKFTKIILRDSAEEILKAIAMDMETAQTPSEQADKSKGRGARLTHRDTAAEIHAAERLRLDFSQAQLASEFRALRATVTRLWMESLPDLGEHSNVHQLIRFNEGIDQALTESSVRFMQETNTARDLAIAVVAHDLRNPLNAIVSSAQILQISGFDKAVEDLAANMLHSGMRMSKLIDNLLDFTSARFGQPLIIKRELIDFTLVCQHTIAEFVAANPERIIHSDCDAGIQGALDEVRISQMLANLISNALQHGDPTTPVSVEAHGESQEVVLTVHNHGVPIPQSDLQTIFDPFARTAKQDKYTRHLGLGLFVAREIVEAHGGKISVTSTAEDGTRFVVRLPRHTTPE